MQIKKRSILFWIMLVVGLGCTLAMLGLRLISEHGDRNVAVAVSYGEVVKLAALDGRDESDWLKDFSSYGVHYLIGTDENEAVVKAAAEAAEMEFARSGNTAKEGDAFLLPYLVRSRNIDPYDVPKGDSSVPLALVENYTRTGVIMPESFNPDLWSGSMVKTLNMYDAYSYHYVYDEPYTENENILFRAITERGMRLIILTPLEYEEGGTVTDPAAYEDMLSGLVQRSADRGLIFGNKFSTMSAPKTSKPLLAGCIMLLSTAAVLFICILFPIKKLGEIILLCAGAAVSLGGVFVLPLLMQKLAAFAAAVLTPCFAVLLLAKTAVTGKENIGMGRLVFKYIKVFALLLAISLCGGLYIASVLATRLYMLQFAVFKGVKLAQLIPLAVSLVLLLAALYGRFSPLRGQKRRSVPAALIVVMVICAAAAIAVIILRSGDNMLPVSSAEIKTRNWLEYTLYARPRTKEFLMAFPALGLFIAACDRRVRIFQLLLGVMSTVGAVSVVNTFCHIFTPVRVSLIRTLLSAGIGLVIGVIALVIFRLLLGKDGVESNV